MWSPVRVQFGDIRGGPGVLEECITGVGIKDSQPSLTSSFLFCCMFAVEAVLSHLIFPAAMPFCHNEVLGL